MDLAFRFSLSLLEVDKDRKVGPPELPVCEGTVAVVNHNQQNNQTINIKEG